MSEKRAEADVDLILRRHEDRRGVFRDVAYDWDDDHTDGESPLDVGFSVAGELKRERNHNADARKTKQ